MPLYRHYSGFVELRGFEPRSIRAFSAYDPHLSRTLINNLAPIYLIFRSSAINAICASKTITIFGPITPSHLFGNTDTMTL